LFFLSPSNIRCSCSVLYTPRIDAFMVSSFETGRFKLFIFYDNKRVHLSTYKFSALQFAVMSWEMRNVKHIFLTYLDDLSHLLSVTFLKIQGHAVAQLVEVLRYKSNRSRLRFPMVSLKFFIDIILPAAPRPWCRLSL